MRPAEGIQALKWSLILLIAALSGQLHAQQVAPHWKLEPGQRYALEWRAEDDSNFGQTAIQSRETLNVTWHVADLQDGVFSISTRFDRLRSRTERNGAVTEFDTDSHADAEASSSSGALWMLYPLVGQETTIKMDSRGELLEIDIPDGVRHQLEGVPGPDAHSMLKLMWQMIIPPMPDAAVFPGATWKDELVGPGPGGSVTVPRTMTYEGEQQVDGRRLHRIAVEMEIPDEGREMEEQSAVGRMHFDGERGYMHSFQLEFRGTDDDYQMSMKFHVTIRPIDAP